MKAISLWQPWATLMVINRPNEAVGMYPPRKAKGIETRGRAIRHRGELAIHATKTWQEGCLDLCTQEPFLAVFLGNAIMVEDIPLGAIIGVGRLVAAHPTEQLRSIPRVMVGGWTWDIDDTEKAFGNYEDGRYGMLFAEVRALPRPVSCKGSQIIPWDVPPDVEAQVREQLRASA